LLNRQNRIASGAEPVSPCITRAKTVTGPRYFDVQCMSELINGVLRAVGAVARWPRCARRAKVHAIITACVLWIALAAAFWAGSGDRNFAGTIKGPDFLQFYTMGFLVNSGRTSALYDTTRFHEAQVGLVPTSGPELYPPVYPPHVALIFSPFSRLSFSTATFLWNMLTVLLFGGVIVTAWKAVSDQLRDGVFVVAAAAAFPPFWSLILFGQATIVIVLAFWLAWVALKDGRRFLAGVAFGALLFKPQFGLPVAIIVLVSRDWPIVFGGLVSVAVQYVVVVLTLGRDVVRAYANFVPIMIRYADLLEPKPFQSHSLRALTRLAPVSVGLPLWVMLSGVVLALAVGVWRSEAPASVQVGVCTMAALLINPHVIVYDAAVVGAPILWLGGYIQRVGSEADARDYWICVYWLFVTFLMPTAFLIGVQVSVLLMIWLLILIARTVADQGRIYTVQESIALSAVVVSRELPR